jgi:purine-cytosine permease-like protein
MPMLRRYFIYFTFAMLFALTQQAAVTHEISHISDGQQSSQKQDKTTHTNFCEKCMSFGDLVSSIHSSPFSATLLSLDFTLNLPSKTHHSNTFLFAYSARAPPHTS